jgi:predicted ATPase
MLTRLEIDNFRCFEGFVWEPARKQLILGANGCGKSSMMDALTNLRRFVAGDAKVEELFPLRERTKWLDRAEQKFGIDAMIAGETYSYRLVVDAGGSPEQPQVKSETLCHGGQKAIEFDGVWAKIFKGAMEGSVDFLNDSSRSAVSALPYLPHESANFEDFATAIRAGNSFLEWLSEVQIFQLNPFPMIARSEAEDWRPASDLVNFASWYRHVVQLRPDRRQAFFGRLQESIDGFDALHLDHAGENVRVLVAGFSLGNGAVVKFRFEDLSEGQRCLICLYAVLHFIVAEGGTVVIDEPENFVSLREIQPWLTTAEDVVEDAHGQLILMSHHPEFIDQWAPPYGVRFIREDFGPVRVKPWTGDPGSRLSAAELVARGWDDD